MIRIALAQFGLETSSFAPGVTVITDYDPNGFTLAEKIIPEYTGTRTSMGGALKAIADEGAVPFTTDILVNQGNFMGGPQMCDKDLNIIMDRICGQLDAIKDQIDGLFFALHGAGTSETEDDLDTPPIDPRELAGSEGHITEITRAQFEDYWDQSREMPDGFMGMYF